MLETFTPAVCGSRKRQIVAQALFGGAAVAAAAVLGIVLGLAGSALGAERAVLAAAALALLAAAREAGLVRLPLPQARRQVPERWRFEHPLPVWASGYGAGLGAGLFTFQPVSTFWVACAGALALARPAAAALCLSLYGAGRALTAVWPRRQAGDPTAAVERLVARRGALLKANAVALAACAVLLAAAPAAAGATREARDALDPSAHEGALAFARPGGGVVVRGDGSQRMLDPEGSEPSVHRHRAAYAVPGGIVIANWRTGKELKRITSARAAAPALQWPLLAFVRRDANWKRLVLRNLEKGWTRYHARVSPRNDLGRPSLRNGKLAWHVTSRRSSRVFVKTLSSGNRRRIAKSKISLLANPSVTGWRVVWTDTRFGVSQLKERRLAGGRTRTLKTIKSRTRVHWTTALDRRTAYSTRWTLGTTSPSVYSTRF